MLKILQPKTGCGACAGCSSPTANFPQLRQMGLSLDKFDRVVALAGNPNTGKSTVFNRLTGLKQHTGNWPGKTVARAEGAFVFRHLHYKLVDLPGTYSLLSASTDEEIARDFILFGRPDCTLVVVDATALERNLNLVLQVLEISAQVVVCVNLMDEAARKGVIVDVATLGQELGVPAIATVARTGEGFDTLLSTMADVIEGRTVTHPHQAAAPKAVQSAMEELLPMIERLAPGLPNARWVAFRLLEGDTRVRKALLSGELALLANQPVKSQKAETPK